jgi:O-antigen/teichoic acid export membrane protein
VLVYVLWVIWGRLKKMPSQKTEFKFNLLTRNVTFGFPVYISTVIDSFITQMDVIMIGFFLGGSPGIVSGYAAVIAFVRNIGPVVSVPLGEVQVPILVEEFEKKSEAFGKIVKEISRWTVYLGVPVMCVFLVYSDALLGIVANKYRDNAYLMWYFVPFVLATLISASSRNALLARGHVKVLLLVSSIIVGINFAINWALIPAIGVAGAAIGSSVAAVIGEGTAVYFARKKFDAKLHFDIIKAFAAGTAAVALGYISLPLIGTLAAFGASGILNLIIGMSITCSIYILGIVLLKGLKRIDFERGMSILRRQKLGVLADIANPFVNIICKTKVIYDFKMRRKFRMTFYKSLVNTVNCDWII